MANGQRVTPALNSRGLFEVDHPFRLREKQVYEVIAIREFPDFWAEHVDVFETYYEPYGLTEKDYERDRVAGAAIVSLLGEEGVLFIPDTYILSYPELGYADYQHVVLSVSLGALHRKRNLSGLKKEVGELISGYLGIKPNVNIHVGPVKEQLTLQEAQTLESVRKGTITHANTAELQARKARAQRDAIASNVNANLLKRYKK